MSETYALSPEAYYALRLDAATDLLERALQKLDDVHAYESQIAQDIREYLEGGE